MNAPIGTADPAQEAKAEETPPPADAPPASPDAASIPAKREDGGSGGQKATAPPEPPAVPAPTLAKLDKSLPSKLKALFLAAWKADL